MMLEEQIRAQLGVDIESFIEYDALRSDISTAREKDIRERIAQSDLSAKRNISYGE